MFQKYGIDFSKTIPFGPRQPDGFCRGGSNPLQPGDGVDADWDDDELLRFANGWSFKLEELCVGLFYHLEWRKTYFPFPRLTDPILKILHTGVLYLHGRCIDHSPILVMNFGVLKSLLKTKQIDADLFCAVHSFFATYIKKNMLIPGMVEKWSILGNVNGFPLTDIPVSMFKEVTYQIGYNWIDYGNKTVVVNLSWF